MYKVLSLAEGFVYNPLDIDQTILLLWRVQFGLIQNFTHSVRGHSVYITILHWDSEQYVVKCKHTVQLEFCAKWIKIKIQLTISNNPDLQTLYSIK